MSTVRHEVQIRTTDNRGRMLLPQWKAVQTVFNVVDFGARGDGVTDDTVAIQAAFTAAAAANDSSPITPDYPDDIYGGSARVVAIGNFRITSTITVPCDFDGSRATFLVASTLNPVIKVTGPANAVVSRKIIDFPELIHTAGASLATPAGIGVQIVNAQFCKFTFGKIERFGTGISLLPVGDGCSWNQFQLGWMLNCDIGLDIGHGINGTSAWANENQFFGGAFSITSGSSVPNTRYIRIGRCNGLTFYSPALEGDAPEYHVECGGRFNMIFMPRFEGVTGLPRVLFTDLVGAAFSSGCDNAIWMGMIAGTGTGGLVVTNNGAFAARNNIQAWAPGAAGGITHQGSSEYWDANLSGGTATLAVDSINHKVGVGVSAPTDKLSIAGVQNIGFANWSFLGQVGSTLGTLLGYNAKATPNSVGEKIEAANTYGNGAKFVLVTDAGIKLQASNTAVNAADDITASGLKMTVDNTGVKLTNTPAFSASAKYLVLGTDGYIRVSALGPAS